jgi:hypothetical protein
MDWLAHKELCGCSKMGLGSFGNLTVRSMMNVPECVPIHEVTATRAIRGPFENICLPILS